MASLSPEALCQVPLPSHQHLTFTGSGSLQLLAAVPVMC